MLNRTFVIAASMALAFIVPASAQEKLVGTYGEARTALAFNIPAATVQKILPQGWLASPFSAGPAKGANLVVTFMDWLVAQDPDGKPTNTYSHVGLTVPAKQNGTDATVAMVVAGLSAPPGYAPGPYGNFGAAKSIIARTLRVDDDGVSRAEESWQFEGEKKHEQLAAIDEKCLSAANDYCTLRRRLSRRKSLCWTVTCRCRESPCGSTRTGIYGREGKRVGYRNRRKRAPLPCSK
jgi:hypothetical protein